MLCSPTLILHANKIDFLIQYHFFLSLCVFFVFILPQTASRTSTKASKKKRQSLYSIEFSPPVDTILDYELDVDTNRNGAGELSPKPMTPRRVKRRSVMTRGTNNRQSTNSRRSHASNNRNSMRSSRRKVQNPVTKLMEFHNHQQQLQQQQLQQQQQQPHQSNQVNPQFQHHQSHRASKSYTSTQHHENSAYLTKSNLKHLNGDIPTANLNKSFRKPTNFTQNIVPDPIYYNMSQSTTFFEPSWNASSSTNLTSPQEQQQQPSASQGHFNPTYQHSTPNLNASNPEMVDEVYNNRPPSVRSSYSNFHGTRPLSTSVAESENVFVGLNNMQSMRSQPMAIPQLPSRQSASRESIRSMAFLNNGPPAYNLNYHTPPDSNSETTM